MPIDCQLLPIPRTPVSRQSLLDRDARSEGPAQSTIDDIVAWVRVGGTSEVLHSSGPIHANERVADAARYEVRATAPWL
jgi:hypothetical protein